MAIHMMSLTSIIMNSLSVQDTTVKREMVRLRTSKATNSTNIIAAASTARKQKVKNLLLKSTTMGTVIHVVMHILNS